jgi:lysophospholipase L1-like esterase
MLAIFLLTTGCGTLIHPTVRRTATPNPSPDTRPLKIVPLLVIGDSITVGARDIGLLPGLLETSGWNAEIVAEVGVGTQWALQQVEQRQVVPRIVLVELGSNPSPLLDDFEARDPTRYAEKDAVIARVAGNRVQVSAWPTKLQQNPQWFGDELHLTQEGYRALAEFMREELQQLHG